MNERTDERGHETLHHAATRVLRFLKIDEVQGGGLLSVETIKAGDMLRVAITRAEKRAKEGARK